MLKWAGVALSAWLFSGCVVVDHHGVGSATLTVEWSIAGSSDPDECSQSDVRYAYVRVETRSGGVVDEFEARCDDGATEVDLDPGTYWVTVVLRDRSGGDRTTAVESDRVTLYGHDDVTVHVDFPDDSFL
jgi:hypothetical protein